METKFTKGEWDILPIEEDKEYIRIRGTVLGGRYKIANITDLKHHHDGSDWCESERLESKANAHLMAAAPDMYEMLEIITHTCRSMASKTPFKFEFKALQAGIEQVLSKARGEQ